ARAFGNTSVGGWFVIRLTIGFWALIIIWVDVRLWRQNFRVINALSMEESVDSGITLLKRVKHILRFEGQWKI
ncbi:hypothetical protein Golax_025828, partial [Gossypium laxum]|nr:hypothetical protein [Gossypium laxum]